MYFELVNIYVSQEKIQYFSMLSSLQDDGFGNWYETHTSLDNYVIALIDENLH